MFNGLPGLTGGLSLPTAGSADELADLDNFLDSYLAHLQAEPRGAGQPGVGLPQNGAAAGLGMQMGNQQQPLGMQQMGLGQGMQQRGHGAEMFGFNQQLNLGVQGGGFGQQDALGGGMGGGMPQFFGNMPPIPQTQAHQQHLQQLQLQQLQAGIVGGLSVPKVPVTTTMGNAPGLAPEPVASAKPGSKGAKGTTAATTAKGGRKGRATTAKGKAKSEPGSSEDLDSSGGDSDSSGDEQRSKKKREGPMDESERKHLALQEKNRKAQRRFRERQKAKLTELHKQIDELSGKVSGLQTENAALHSRTSILEKVLDMRNEQIQVMQENKEVNETELANMNQNQANSAELVSLTPEMMKELSSEEIYKIYQTYVKELSVKLVDVNKSNEGPGLQELERLVRDLSVMIMRLGVAKPLETRKFIVFSRQYLGNTENEVIDLWRTVLRNIDLTPQQMREIVDLKRMFLQKIEPIMDERKHLNVSIQSNLPHDTFHTKNSISYIKAHEAVSKLRDNLRSEQHVVLEFAIAVFRGVFKPRQMATLLVKCYPAVPDALGIASALASELGEPDTAATNMTMMQLGGYGQHAAGSMGLGMTPQQGAAGGAGGPMASGLQGTAGPSGSGGAMSGGGGFGAIGMQQMPQAQAGGSFGMPSAAGQQQQQMAGIMQMSGGMAGGMPGFGGMGGSTGSGMAQMPGMGMGSNSNLGLGVGSGMPGMGMAGSTGSGGSMQQQMQQQQLRMPGGASLGLGDDLRARSGSISGSSVIN